MIITAVAATHRSMETKMRVALYARYSSDAQRDASIEDQLRICHLRAEREGWVVTVTFTDHALSGASVLRPGYQALLARMRSGGIDVVLSESLDRLSRDQEHIAAFYKQANFAGVRIVTLAEGEISELHIGLKGTMGALYLKDLADKTRRGEEGRILKGRSVGTVPYGYRMVRRLDANGEPERGLREIEPREAAIVERIFRGYAAGASPLSIARTLNGASVPGPAGGLWYQASIRGRPTRNDGVLRNALYIGKLVWNRRRNSVDPLTGQPVRRLNPATAVITVDVPHLRIIDQALWDAVQVRLATEAINDPTTRPARPGGNSKEGFWSHRRPRHLLTGKVMCGVCQRRVVAYGQDYLACQGGISGKCRNRRSVRRAKLEGIVLASLRHELMAPDAVVGFIEAFNEEWQRQARIAGANKDMAGRELASVERKLGNIVNAIAEGLRNPTMQRQLDELEARRTVLEAEITAAPGPRPLLPPNLADTYRARLGELEASVADRRTPDVLEAARALVDKVILHPGDDPGGCHRIEVIEVIGAIEAMLHAAGVDPPAATADKSSTVDQDLFVSSLREAAGGKAPWPYSPPPCSITIVGTTAAPSRMVNSRVPGLRPGFRSDTGTPSAFSRA